MLTAGGTDQLVSDGGPNGHSVFTWTLLQALGGKADLNGDGLITGTELAAYVAPAVSSVSQQTPAFGSLPGSEGGEFVFELPEESEFLNTATTQLSNDAIALNTQARCESAGGDGRGERPAGRRNAPHGARRDARCRIASWPSAPTTRACSCTRKSSTRRPKRSSPKRSSCGRTLRWRRTTSASCFIKQEKYARKRRAGSRTRSRWTRRGRSPT
jgi:hypothetical protein